ncbi:MULTISPECIES: ABC transporter ATP-binding protein [Xenophilus]|uniref:ABC transporter ATP-binding protein n=1 Tax=Xenophilus TaxID=151754 RepID=UPI00056DE4E6|nr:ATP-binding cassette domain-containing protein [Xenophilus azovorans]
MLEVRGLEAGYGASRVVHGVDLAAVGGEVVSLVGRNGVGKTTTLKAIMGLVDVHGGEVRVRGETITPAPALASRRGIGYVAQQREICPDLTVEENLLVPLYANRLDVRKVELAYKRFGRLAERRAQVAGSLSGGERKLLAFARIMLLEPSIYLIDEPTEGLMPKAVDEIGGVIAELAGAGACVVLVEQNLALLRQLSTRVYLMNNGRVEATADTLGAAEAERFLGI